MTKKIISTAVRISKGSKETLKLGNIEIKRDWGFVPEYVKAMWLILQQEEANDYVIATGESHSLREFAKLAFARLSLNWEEHVIIDKDLYRPFEIDVIYGDPAKARASIGWEYNLPFENLIKLLVEEELQHWSEVIRAKQ